MASADSIDAVAVKPTNRRESMHPPFLSQPPTSAPSHTRSLSYYCISTIAQEQPQPWALAGFLSDTADRGVIEFALCTEELVSLPIQRARVRLSEMHALVSRSVPPTTDAASMHDGSAAAPLVHSPAFRHCCSRLRCRVFDVLCYPATESAEGCAVTHVHEALTMALVAHGRQVPLPAAAATVNNERELGKAMHCCEGHPLLHVAQAVHCLMVSHLLPVCAAPWLALGLTLRSPASMDESAAPPPVSLCWSWVDVADVESDVGDFSFMASSGACPHVPVRPDSLPHGDALVQPLLQHWTAAVTSGEDATPADGRCSAESIVDVYSSSAAFSSVVHRRLHRYADRAEQVLVGSSSPLNASAVRYGSCHATEAQRVARRRLFAACAAVLTECKTLMDYWAAPSTALDTRGTDTVCVYLEAWFCFLGSRVGWGGSAAEVQTSVRAVLLVEAGAETRMQHAWQSQLPQVQLGIVCRWLVTQMLQILLCMLPSVVDGLPSAPAAAAAALGDASTRLQGPMRVEETHLLFRSGSSAVGKQNREAVRRRQLEAQAHTLRATPSRHTATTSLFALLDAVLKTATTAASSAGSVTPSSPSMFPSQGSHRSHLPALTAGLFLDPSAHGTAACRLHLGVSPPVRHSEKEGGEGSTLQRQQVVGFSVVRGPVLSLLSWYAADFECTFGHAYGCYDLRRRYDICAAHCPADGSGSSAGLVDPAIVYSKRQGRQGVVDGMSGEPERSPQHDAAPLGLLARCLLLGLWMQLRLVDVDADAHASDGGVRVCGALHYSGRRNMLFVRDWRTLQHLHCVVVGARDGTQGSATAAAAATVVAAFVRARQSVATAQQRHTLSVKAALQQRRQREHEAAKKQRERERAQEAAACLVQSCLRAHYSSMVVRQQRRRVASTNAPSRVASDIVTAAETSSNDSGDCVLLHWSAITDNHNTNSSSSNISEGNSCDVALHEGSEEAQTPSPRRELAKDVSFAVSVEECEMEVGEALWTMPQSNTALTTPLDKCMTEGFVRALCELSGQEARERVLVEQERLSASTRLLRHAADCKRRLYEQQEQQERALLVHYANQSTKALRRPCIAAQEEEAVHAAAWQTAALTQDDEEVPTVFLPLATKPSDATLPALLQEESQARRQLEAREAATRHQLFYELVVMHRQERNRLAAYEAHQRRFLEKVYALHQLEWQLRWRTIVVPECVLREALREAYGADGADRSNNSSNVIDTTAASLESTRAARCGSAVGRSRHAPSSRMRAAVSRVPVVETLAAAQREFLLYGDDVSSAAEGAAAVVNSSDGCVCPPEERPRVAAARQRRRSAPSFSSSSPSFSCAAVASGFESAVQRQPPRCDTGRKVPAENAIPATCCSPSPSPHVQQFSCVEASRGAQVVSIPVVTVSLREDACSSDTSTNSSVKERKKRREESRGDGSEGCFPPPEGSAAGWFVPLLQDEANAPDTNRVGRTRRRSAPTVSSPREQPPSRVTTSLRRKPHVGSSDASTSTHLFVLKSAVTTPQRLAAAPSVNPRRRVKKESVAAAVAAAIAVASDSSSSSTARCGVISEAEIQCEHRCVTKGVEGDKPKEKDERKSVAAAAAASAGGAVLEERDRNTMPHTKPLLLPPQRSARRRYVTWADDVVDH